MFKKLLSQLLVLQMLVPQLAMAQEQEPRPQRPRVEPLIIDWKPEPIKIDFGEIKPIINVDEELKRMSLRPIRIPIPIEYQTDYACEDPSLALTNLDDVSKGVVVNCWENPPSLDADDNEKFAYQAGICNCLNSSRQRAVKSIMSASFRSSQGENAVLNYLDKNFDKLQLQLDNFRNGLNSNMFQFTGYEKDIGLFDPSLLVSRTFGRIREQSHLDGQAQTLVATPDGSGVDKRSLESTQKDYLSDAHEFYLLSKENTNGTIRRLAARGSDFVARAGSTVETLVGKLNAPADNAAIEQVESEVEKKYSEFISRPANKNNDLIKDPPLDIEGGQCKTARHFIKHQGYPQYNFNKKLEASDLGEDQWDYNKLKAEFKLLSERKDPATIDKAATIRGKLLFLSRNPALKHLLAADLDDKSRWNRRHFNQQEMQDIELAKSKLDAVGGIKRIKKDAIAMISKMVNSCSSFKNNDERANCLNKESDTKKEYDDKMNAIFSDDSVSYLTNMQSRFEIPQLFKDFNDNMKDDLGRLQNEVPFDRYEKFMGHSDIVRVSPEDCEINASNDLATCVEKYASLCPIISNVMKKRAEHKVEKFDPVFNDDLDKIMANNFNTEFKGPNANPDYKSYLEHNCKKPYPKKGSRGEESFNDNYLRICGQRRTGDCSLDPANIERMYQEYAKGHKLDRQATASSGVQTNESANLDNIPTEAASFSDWQKSRGGSNARSYSSNESLSEKTAVTPSLSGLSAPLEDAGVSSTSTSEAGTDMGMMPMMNPLFSQLPAEGEKLSEEDKENIRTLAEEEVARDRRELASTTNSAEKSRLEERLKLMEDLLSQKSESEKKYQELLSQLNQRLADVESGKTQVASRAQQASSNQRRAPASAPVQSNSTSSSDDQERSRIQVPNLDQRTNTAGSNGQTTAGQASAFKSSSAGSARSSSGSGANSALLDAAIARGKASSDGAAIIVQEVDRGTATAIENTANAGQQIALNVPANVYAQFQSENVEVLRRYKDQILKNVEEDQPVRLVVKNGQQSLNIVVIKRNGNLVFMPPRVFSLKSLNQQLQSTTRSPSGI